MTAPLYGKETNDYSWGCDFPELVKLIAQAIEKHSIKKKVTVVCHDWGCGFTVDLQMSRPDLISRVVSLDIGGTMSNTLGFNFFRLSYQWFIILCWFLGEPVGGTALRALIGPAVKHRPNAEIKAQMGYPYWYSYMGNLKWVTKNKGKWNPDTTDMPIFFGYGRKKIAYFHD